MLNSGGGGGIGEEEAEESFRACCLASLSLLMILLILCCCVPGRRGAGACGEAALAIAGLSTGAERVSTAPTAAAEVPLQPHVTPDPCARTCTCPSRGGLRPPCGCGAGPQEREGEGEEEEREGKQGEREREGDEREDMGVDSPSLSAVRPLC